MKRPLLKSSAFVRTAKRIIKKNPNLENNLYTTLELLSNNAFHPSLKTHKLKGNFKGLWACSVNYDLRIVFEFVDYS
ncbi:MAG: type II toxin-antitoxin system mRNA interferase toxin, RelE/StbE family [Thiomargarita sp.]|nr:type II toxin-antitoxin system mRNA interferase toxin, RelE/StbE family [Thiomargarita sp.]